MHLITRLGAAGMLVAALAACQVTITPFVPPAVDHSVNAQSFLPDGEVPTSLRRITVPARSEVWVLASFGSSQAELRYVEVEPVGSGSGVQLEVWGSTGRRPLLVSRSPLLFGTPSAVASSGLESLGGVGRSSISFPWRCEGPCIAERYRSGDVYVRIANAASSSRTVDFYAYGIDAWDTTSSDQANPTVVDLSAFSLGDAVVSAAIETVDDVDVFAFTCPSGGPWFGAAFLTLRTQPVFESAFELVTSVGTFGVNEGTPLVPCGSIVRVRSANGTAGPSDASLYVIEAD